MGGGNVAIFVIFKFVHFFPPGSRAGAAGGQGGPEEGSPPAQAAQAQPRRKDLLPRLLRQRQREG